MLPSETSRSGAPYGSGRSKRASTTLKTAVFAPIPSANVSTIIDERSGARTKKRRLSRTCSRASRCARSGAVTRSGAAERIAWRQYHRLAALGPRARATRSSSSARSLRTYGACSRPATRPTSQAARRGGVTAHLADWLRLATCEATSQSLHRASVAPEA